MVVTLVQKYNSEWPRWFKEIKAFLGEKMSQACIRIEHVGSTSIPGMTAKPIIDLILVIEPKRFGEIKSLLEERGYYHKGDLDIKEREVFDLKDEAVKKSVPNHHLYVCLEHSAELKKETAFREQCKTLHVVIPPELWQEDKARLAAKISATSDSSYPEEKERALRWARR